MKKLLLALPLVAGASWAGTSYYAGVQSENAYDQFLNQTQIMKPLVFEKESFENGVTTSHAITAVRQSTAADAKVIFRLQHEINHSPIQLDDNGTKFATATIRTTLVNESGNQNSAAIREFFNGEEPFEILSTADINGKIVSTLNIEAFDIDTTDEKLSLGQSSFDITTENNRTQVKGTLGELQANFGNGTSVDSSESYLNFDITIDDTWAYDYDFMWSAGELSLSSDQSLMPVKIANISLGGDSKLANEKFDQSLVFELGKIDFGGAIPADLVPIDTARFSLDLVDLSFSGIKEYSDRLDKLTVEEQMSSTPPTDAEALAVAASMVSPNSTLDIKLELGNPAGAATADYAIRFVGDESPSGYDDIVTVADLLNAIEMDVNVGIDKAALDLTPAAMFMDSPQMQMAFVDIGEQIVSRASLRGAAVEVNGNFFPLQSMFGGMLDMPIDIILEMEGL